MSTEHRVSFANELDTLVGALRFFTRLPIAARRGDDGIALERAIRYFPAAGLLIGGIAAPVFVATSFFWPKTLAVLAAMAAAIYVTGAIHEDGLSDMVDGFGGGYSKDKVLSIMRDSCVGSFGALALFAMLLARFSLLLDLDSAWVPAALIAGHAVSRLCATGVLAALDYARPDGKAKPFGNRLSVGDLLLATLSASLPLFFLPLRSTVLALVLAAGVTVWLGRLFQRRIGGYTGDCLGAAQQLAEVAFYAGLLCQLA